MPASFPNGSAGVGPQTYVSGRYYAPIHAQAANTQALIINTVYLAPLFVGPSGVILRGFGVRTGTTGASTVLLGVYNSTSGGRPALRVATLASALSTPTINTDYTADMSADVTLGAGQYWAAIIGDTTNAYNSTNGADNLPSGILGATSIVSAMGSSGQTTGESYAVGSLSLPADLTGLTAAYTGNMPLCVLRVR